MVFNTNKVYVNFIVSKKDNYYVKIKINNMVITGNVLIVLKVNWSVN